MTSADGTSTRASPQGLPASICTGLVLIWLTASPLMAQPPSARPGAHDGTIEGEIVVTSDAVTLPHRVTVQLHSRQLGFSETRILSRGESFEFKGLRSAVYLLRASCADHQPIEQSVSLAGSLRAEVVRVRLELDSPIEADTPRGGAKTVSVSNLGIPPKALQELKKAGKASEKGKHRQAIVHLRKAVRHHPDFAEAYNNLAVSYFRLGDYEKALGAAERARAINRDDGIAHGNLAMILLAQGKHQEAQALFIRSLELRPGRPEIQLQLANLSQALGDYQLAGKLFVEIWNQGTQPDSLLLLAAGCYFRAGNISRSAALIDRFAQLHPDDSRLGELRSLLEKASQPRP